MMLQGGGLGGGGERVDVPSPTEMTPLCLLGLSFVIQL